MNTIQQVARQAADAEYRAWQRQAARTTEDTPLVDRVADAVAVAVLRHLIAVSQAYETHDKDIERMVAAFTPAEPPQQETEVLRAPTNRAETVADPRGLDPFLSPAASRDVDGDQMFSLTSPSLEQFLARYYSWCVVGNEARGEWFWLDQIEDTIGRERYRQIMRGDKTDV